ncbi:MAG: zinc finger domain-containing protein [bacterium]
MSKTCPTCDGKGYVINYVPNKNGELVRKTETCPHCGGTGDVKND